MRLPVAALLLAVVAQGFSPADRVQGSSPAAVAQGSCFLLYEIGVGQQRRSPSGSCASRISPQSTFKIPHALAALDAGVITEAETIPYDGHPVDFAAWGRPHTLLTAMRFSVVWVFQEIAKRLGVARERAYLERFNYGNQDASSGLTTFWLGGSLAISPDEQQDFVLRMYGGSTTAATGASRTIGAALAVKPSALEIVKRILIQPSGRVVNARGEQAFAAPWPQDAVVSAKTGSGRTREGGQVRWLVGHVRRGSRAWVFVSNVVGGADTPVDGAVRLAERGLIEERVLR
jgi:beta-lactamase class D